MGQGSTGQKPMAGQWPRAGPQLTSEQRYAAKREKGIVRAIRKAVNWVKVQECQQGNIKHLSEYYAQLVQQTRLFGGVDPEKVEKRSLMVSFFVDQSAPEMKKYFSKPVQGWQGKGLDEIVSIATFVLNGRDERQLKQKKERTGTES